MHEIHPKKLWLGHALDLRSPQPIFDAGIRAVVDVAYEELPAQLPRKLIYCRFPINDGSGNDLNILLQALRSIVGFLDSEIPVLVGCSAGMSRSPTIAAFALASYTQRTPEEVIEDISNVKTLDLKMDLWKEIAQVFAGQKDERC